MGAQRTNSIHYWILFWIWPLSSAVLSLKNFRSSWAKNIFWAFVVFFGFTFAVGEEASGSDINRYAQEVERLHGEPLSLESGVEYFKNSGEIDILRTLIALLVSRFTDLRWVLTVVYSIIFGFFYSRNVWFVLDRCQGKLSKTTVLLLVCLFLVIPFWFINGFRFWSAAHVFIYGMLPFLYGEGKKSLWWCVITPFVFHFSFIIPLGILGVYLLLGNRMVGYYIFFLSSVFISEIDVGELNNFIESYAPKTFAQRSEGYRMEDEVEEFRKSSGKGKVWYAVYYRMALVWSLSALLISAFWYGKKELSSNLRLKRIFCFSLLFFGVANILSSLPSGSRFLSPAAVFALVFIVLYHQNMISARLSLLVRFTFPLLLLFIVVAVRDGFYFISISTISGNPILASFFSEHISLNDLIK